MKVPSKIAHPLKNRTGTSQRTRIIDALQTETAPIDGKTLADQLYLICEYAGYINFHKYIDDTIEGEYQQLDTWSSFFDTSLPFQLAKLSKVSIADLEEQFLLLHHELEVNPTKQSLESLLGFVNDKLIVPTNVLYKTVASAENSFTVPLLAIIKSSFLEPLRCYIALYNSSATFLCVDKKKFTDYLAQPWQLKVDEVYALDLCIKRVKKGKSEAFAVAAKELNTIFFQMLNGLQAIVEEAPLFIEESLRPLEESLRQKHDAHLALLFTFLELLKYFQGNINELGKKHLDFFYEQVLRLVPKEAVPDKAHIVFEVAKHLEAYPLPEDLLLKDGKDENKQDIQFGLDHEIVLDKAKIQDLRTLALHSVIEGDEKYIEGVYMAPMSNSLDGLGKKFKADQPNNWPTLGSKYSKFIPEGSEIADKHPNARLGFVLSSPVLLLQEGLRTITISLDCQLNPSGGLTLDQVEKKLSLPATKDIFILTQSSFENCLQSGSALSPEAKTYLSGLLLKETPYIIDKDKLQTFFEVTDPISCLPIFSENDIRQIMECLEEKNIPAPRLFRIQFSGEKEWLNPELEDITISVAAITEGLNFKINIKLKPDFPAVVFYDEESLEQKLDLRDTFPLVKIELNEEIQINCGPKDGTAEDCCLRKSIANHVLWVSPYHFLQKLKLIEANIDVKVCGVKNLIVQNDDNLQDINKPIYPFGPRPKVGEGWLVDKGANFYIGSKEVFCKNWQRFWINTIWKDKPEDFEQHYKFYKDMTFEDGSPKITNESFRFATSILDNGIWKKDILVTPAIPNPIHPEYMNLFATYDIGGNPCPKSADTSTFCHEMERKLPPPPLDLDNIYIPKSMPYEELEPLTVNTRKGFAKLTLAGVSFQHENYTYVLARQMMALAGLFDPVSVAFVQSDLNKSKILSEHASIIANDILTDINSIITEIGNLENQLSNTILPTSQSLKVDVEFVQTNFAANPAQAQARLPIAIGKIDLIINAIGNLLIPGTALGRIGTINSLANEIRDVLILNTGSSLTSIDDDEVDTNISGYGLLIILIDLTRRIDNIIDLLKIDIDLGLPQEPYTPLIKSLSIDYAAIASKDDMEIVHLYPFENTSKHEDIEQTPTLFPYFDDEGTLFIGIEEITPGGSLSLLFQLAEATADSEQDRADIHWHYLANNNWVELLPEFDVISDETDGLTVSGIVTIAVPDAISKVGNTIMPTDFYWIKVSAAENVRAVAETLGIHTQAAKASARLNELNDTDRLETGLEAGSIGKLQEGDFSVKKVEQLYPAFGGRKPEAEGHFYTRVSEHLKHKGRGLMINDYEKVVLEEFPEIYKVKCISHTMGLSANEYRRDLEVAPGFVVVAVIPDLTKLKAGNQLEPKAPVSLLEKIGDHLRQKISPFARLKIMNPRYEPVNVCVSVRLYRGKSENFYAQKLKEDLTFFLAPWFLGDTEKLAFGEEVLFSDVVGFIELVDYVDFIVDLRLEGLCEQTGTLIQPLTARSILTAGTICVKIDQEECPSTVNVEPSPEFI